MCQCAACISALLPDTGPLTVFCSLWPKIKSDLQLNHDYGPICRYADTDDLVHLYKGYDNDTVTQILGKPEITGLALNRKRISPLYSMTIGQELFSIYS